MNTTILTERREHLQPDDDYISVREAAHRLGVSPRAVYTYIKDGDLTATLLVGRQALKASDVLAFRPTGAGRKRHAAPVWRTPARPSLQIIVTIPLCPEREWKELDPLFEELHKGQHDLPGMIVSGLAQTPHLELQIVLLRRATGPSPAEGREAIKTMINGYLELFDCDQMIYQESQLSLFARM